MSDVRSLSIRIEDKLREKLHYVASAENRSANAHILYLIRKDIEEFEKQHGPIDLDNC